jgi:hypothetical protein
VSNSSGDLGREATSRGEKNVILATLYSLPMWQDILYQFLPSALILGALLTRIFSERHWIRYAYWAVIALILGHYIVLAVTSGWGAVVPRAPDPSVYDPRWGIRFAANLLAWTMVLLALSEPTWRRWLRHRFGLNGGRDR